MATRIGETTQAIYDHLYGEWSRHFAGRQPSGAIDGQQIQWPTVAEIDSRFGAGAAGGAARETDGAAAVGRGWCVVIDGGTVRLHWLQVG
jgi:hypothetical protein